MEIRHNTQALEKALEHVVRKASIPFIEAEATAQAKTARAQGFRRLATGAALGVAAVGIGLGIWLATREPPRSVEVATKTVESQSKTPMGVPTPAPDKKPMEEPPIPRPKPTAEPLPPQPETRPEDIITTDYSVFRKRSVTLTGRAWEISAGHQFDSERDPTWKHAWCYTRAEVTGLELQIDLAVRESPTAKPMAPIATSATIREARLSPTEVLTLAARCPWLDGKEFSVNEFQGPPGSANPFDATEAKFMLRGRVLKFTGSIGEEFSRKLQNYDFDLLEIDSPGGLVTAAIEAGRWLRTANKRVTVVGNCLSACAFVLAGGAKRTAEPTAHIGVHRFYSIGPAKKDDTENAQIMASSIVRYLSDMGIDNELFHAMSATPSADMLYLDRMKLVQWRLLQPVEVATPPGSGAVDFDLFENTDLPGGDYQTLKQVTVQSCQSTCSIQPQCKAFTYNTAAQWCFLKNSFGSKTVIANAISGVKQPGN